MTRGQPTVLVVDDYPNLLRFARDILEQDFRVDTAADYQEALTKLCEKDPPYDVAVLDIRLDDNNELDRAGLEILKRIQMMGGYTQAVIWTGYETYETMRLALTSLGAIDYLLKNPREGTLDVDLHSSVRRATERAQKLKTARTRLIRGRKYWLPDGISWDLFSFLTGEGTLHNILKGVTDLDNRLFMVLGGRQYDERLGEAKRLLSEIWNMEIGLVPYPFIEVLSEFEFDRRFYPGYRDHVTHQLRVYLLGLYLYHGSPLLHTAVNREFEEAGDAEKQFLRSWKLASTFHDLGYVLEVEEENRKETYEIVLSTLNEFFDNPLLAYCQTHNIPLLKAQEREMREIAGIRSHRVDSIRDLHILVKNDLLDEIEDLTSPALLSRRPGGLKRYYDYAKSNTPVAANRERFIDHGVASAFMLLHLHCFFRDYTASIRRSIQEDVIGTDLFNDEMLQKLVKLPDIVDSYTESVRHAAAAVALHNVQSDIWDHDDAWKAERLTLDRYMLSLDGTPLAFLLALVDALQDWDRPLFSAPSSRGGYICQDQDISITFSGDRIVVTYPTDELAGTSKSKFAKLTRELKKYLKEDDIDALLVEGRRNDPRPES